MSSSNKNTDKLLMKIVALFFIFFSIKVYSQLLEDDFLFNEFGKLQLERTIEFNLGISVQCHWNNDECIELYERILRRPLALNQLSDIHSLYIYGSKDPPRNTYDGQITLGLYASDEEIDEVLQINYNYCPMDSDALFTSRDNPSLDDYYDIYLAAHAQDSYTWNDYLADQEINECLSLEQVVASNLNQELCSESEGFYDRLLQDDVLRITIVRGYFDADNHNPSGNSYISFVSEDQALNMMMEQFQANGFALTDSVQRDIVMNRSMQYQERTIEVILRLVSSTVRCPGEESEWAVYRGRSEVCEEQELASIHARDTFERALATDHVVVYQGHSRYGNGPDFGPYDSSVGKFSINNGALAGIIPQVAQSLLFLGSCSTTGHFTESIHNYRRELERRTGQSNLAFLSNTESEYWDNYPEMATALVNGLLQQQCPQELQLMVNSAREGFSINTLEVDGME